MEYKDVTKDFVEGKIEEFLEELGFNYKGVSATKKALNFEIKIELKNEKRVFRKLIPVVWFEDDGWSLQIKDILKAFYQ